MADDDADLTYNSTNTPLGLPGNRVEGDDLAPIFRLEINDAPLNYDINRLVTSVEYETAIGMADMLKITIDNPGLIDDMFPDWTGHKAFQPGNEVSLYMGYGAADKKDNFIGRCIWSKHMPNFPSEGMPQLTCSGYDLSHKLMDNEGQVVSAGRNTTPTTARPVDTVDDQGQVFQMILHSEVVERIGNMYGMALDIDATTKRDHLIIKKGRKHYELVRGLANINNRDFWVDWDIDAKKWTLHWKIKQRSQVAKYILRYGNNADTNAREGFNKDNTSNTLIDIEPEYGIRELVTTMTVTVFDSKNQRWVSAIEIEDVTGPDPQFHPGGGLQSRAAVARRPRQGANPNTTSTRPRKEARATTLKRQAANVIDEALDNATSFKLAAGGVSIEVDPRGQRFRSIDEAGAWATRWFTARQDKFITAKGHTIGIETLRARQTHTILGLGDRLDGNWFFTRVSHQQGGDKYVCEFQANKVIED